MRTRRLTPVTFIENFTIAPAEPRRVLGLPSRLRRAGVPRTAWGAISGFCVAAILAGSGADFAHAEVIAVDRADYAATTAIANLNGGFGWGSAWTGNNNIVAGSLSRPSVPTLGNRFTTDGNDAGSYRLLATAGHANLLTPAGEFGKEGTTLWLSCLMRRDATTAVGSGRYGGLSFFHNGGAEELLIGIPWEAANWGIHFHDLGANAPGLSATPIVNGTTVWLVVKLTFGISGASDRVDLFVNPSPTASPTTPSATRSGGDIQFTVIRFQTGTSTTTVSMDELRIGTTWEDVAPATEQNFALPLGTNEVHSVGVFKLEKFTQSAPGVVSAPTAARLEAYAFGWPEHVLPPHTNGWYGIFGSANEPFSGWDLTSVALQTIEPINDFEERRQYFGSGPIQFPPPPAVEFATRAALDAAWPDRTYRFYLNGVFDCPDCASTTQTYPLGTVDLDLAGDAYPASGPVLANFTKLQAWPRNEPLELQWATFTGAGPADFVQVLVQRPYASLGGAFTRLVSPLAGESNAIPGTATNYMVPQTNLGTAADGAFATVTFFNVTRINTNQFPGCVGIAGYARQTTVPIHFVDPIVPGISVLDTNVTEGTAAAQVLSLEVRLSLPSNTEVSVHYATVNGSATAGEDYQATSGTLVFAVGETSKIVQVPILPDATPETDETFKLVLSSPVIGQITRSEALATILNDDGPVNPPELSISTVETGGGLFTLAWPANAAGYILEATESLSPPTIWQEVTNGIIASGGIKSYTVTHDPGVPGRLYRLRLP